MFVALESRITTTKSRRAGTLLEMLIAMLLVTLIVGAVVGISITSGRSFAEIMNYIDLGQDNRAAINKLTREVRQATYLATWETNALSFVDPNGATIRYEYSPQARSLLRTQDGAQSTLLKECDSLQFAIYGRVPLTNTFALIPTTEATNCKVISLSWTCSRSMLGLRRHTESAETARIVLRNKQY